MWSNTVILVYNRADYKFMKRTSLGRNARQSNNKIQLKQIIVGFDGVRSRKGSEFVFGYKT